MCGIMGFAGKKEAVKVLLDGLERLEYAIALIFMPPCMDRSSHVPISRHSGQLP